MMTMKEGGKKPCTMKENGNKIVRIKQIGAQNPTKQELGLRWNFHQEQGHPIDVQILQLQDEVVQGIIAPQID